MTTITANVHWIVWNYDIFFEFRPVYLIAQSRSKCLEALHVIQLVATLYDITQGLHSAEGSVCTFVPKRRKALNSLTNWLQIAVAMLKYGM